MLKRLFRIFLLLPIMVIGSAHAVTCQSNEFEYDGNCIENKFQITTTNDTDKFVFNMSAQGTFYIDWGDGNVEMINRTGTTMTEYTHNYASANEYIIKFGGVATAYSTTVPNGEISYGTAIIFGYSTITLNNTKDNLAAISGSLGAIFPTIGNGDTYSKQAQFFRTFSQCKNLISSIPNNLLAGVRGAPILESRFYAMFGSSGVTGSIPEDLFGRVVNGVYDGIDGNVTYRLFNNLFAGCKGLTGAIPENLFGRVVNGVYYGAKGGNNISQVFYKTFQNCTGLTNTTTDDPNNPGKKYAIPPELFTKNINGTYYGIKSGGSAMFQDTFRGCTGLTGSIPGKLFSGISSAPQTYMFHETFYDCTGLTGSIPEDLFSSISGTPRQNMFSATFFNCSGLTGSIPENLFGRVVNGSYVGIDGAPVTSIFQNTFYGCSGLTGPIPGALFGRYVNGTYYGVKGTPATSMFQNTFYGCSHLSSIPEDLFAGINGVPAVNMFYSTFQGCSGLSSSIPENLFGRVVNGSYVGINGTPKSGMFQNTFYECRNLTGSIPENLFGRYVNGTYYGIKGTPAAGVFQMTFYRCSKLTGPLPSGLFAGLSGPSAANMFRSTFNGCTNLGKDTIGGTSVYFIPSDFFANIDGSNFSNFSDSPTYGMFANTGLLTACPDDYYKVLTGFDEENWGGYKVACSACPVAYPDSASGATAITQCYADINYYDSDKTTLLNNNKIYYDSNNAAGFSFPSYTPVKPDSAFVEWDNVSGTAIDTTGTFAGDQSFYAKWQFHCDSGHYFHVGNEQICAAETKRTEHAMVIQFDPEHTYYIHATPNSEHDYTINSSSIHKMKANYNGTIYNLHDASVYFDN